MALCFFVVIIQIKNVIGFESCLVMCLESVTSIHLDQLLSAMENRNQVRLLRLFSASLSLRRTPPNPVLILVSIKK